MQSQQRATHFPIQLDIIQSISILLHDHCSYPLFLCAFSKAKWLFPALLKPPCSCGFFIESIVITFQKTAIAAASMDDLCTISFISVVISSFN